jgi:hypothetical protein
MAENISANSEFINRDLSRSGLSLNQDTQGNGFATPRVSSPCHAWVSKQMMAKLSSNENDTQFHKTMMDKFYHKYSASQDYYFSNQITNILSENLTAPVVKWFDLQTYLDEDEYFKRYYELYEYDNKIRLLAEYYKFHKDIPRLFGLPGSKTMNKYHDEKRKLDYHRIKKMLMEEAAKKNKRVAMNEDDNEIRLTDGDIHESSQNADRHEELTSRSEQTSSVDIEAIKGCNVLPQRLIHSLYKDCLGTSSKKRDSEQASGVTIEDLKEKLGAACRNAKKNWSDFSSVDLSNENWSKGKFFDEEKDELEYKPNFSLQRPSHSMSGKGYLEGKPINLKITDDKARNIKDVNLNINLNLRVLSDHTSSAEYNCFFPNSKSYLNPKDNRKTLKHSPEVKKLSFGKKGSPEGFTDFRKKERPDELRASSKDQTAESRTFKKGNSNKNKHLIDSENSLSQRRLQGMPQLPVAKLKIHTFSKLMKDMGGEYKKATVKTMKLRKSRHLENILVKYKPPQDKTPDIDSARKDKSERKGNHTARTRLHTDKSIKPRGTASSSRGLEKLGIHRSSREKINFKRKKLSLQQTTQNNSKETSKHGFNIDAASLYQTNTVKQKKRTISKSIKGVDAIDLIKDKYNGSISARTKLPTGENSMLQNIMSNLSNKPSKVKLSLSNSIANAPSTGQQKLFSLNVNPQLLQARLEPKENRGSKSRPKRDGRSKSVKSGGQSANNRSGNLQGSKFSRLMHQQMKSKAEGCEINKRSFGDLLSYRAHKDRERANTPFESRDKTRSSNKQLKIAGHTFTIDRLPTFHGYSKSEISQIPVGLGMPNSQLPKFKASISASRIPSFTAPTKVSK